MSFQAFAQAHGLIIPEIISDGRWHRTRTEDHPRKRNGAYVFEGDRGACQNWATMAAPATWREDRTNALAYPIAKPRRDTLAEQRRCNDAAREQAAKLIAECERGTHPYLTAKGFPEALGLIHTSGDLIIPMRDCQDYGTINSVQRIGADGSKLFLTGGKAKGSVFVLGRGARGERFLVEGYATGLSVQAALIELRKRCEVWCCFSAGNLTYVAQFVKRPAIVVADHDESCAGQKAAEATGLPWVMTDEIGDANDAHQKHGVRAIVRLLLEANETA